jgi:hypothetical protein
MRKFKKLSQWPLFFKAPRGMVPPWGPTMSSTCGIGGLNVSGSKDSSFWHKLDETHKRFVDTWLIHALLSRHA